MDWKKLSTTKISEVYKRLFLNQCYLCSSSNTKQPHTLCHHCHNGFSKNTISCQRCKRSTYIADSLCGQCQASLPPYHKCIAPYRFEGIVKNLIHSVKFNQGNHYIRPLTYLLSKHLIDTYAENDWPEQILYVPSHPSRIKERGFCQTQVMTVQLANLLQQHLGKQSPTRPTQNPITKVRHTQAQHSLSRKERLNTPKNSYSVQAPIAKHVALFDDVMTTGSTIETCTKLLLTAGAERVDIWVIARTPDKEHD
jgi:ComF family protein